MIYLHESEFGKSKRHNAHSQSKLPNVLLVYRQNHDELCACPNSTIHSDCPSMSLDKLLNNV